MEYEVKKLLKLSLGAALLFMVPCLALGATIGSTTYERTLTVKDLYNNFEDWSGLTFNPLTQTLFIINSNGGATPRNSIFEINLNGGVLRNININGLVASGSTDPEAITWVSGSTYAVVMESARELALINIVSTTTHLNRSDAIWITSIPSIGTNTVESAVFIPKDQALYYMTQLNPIVVYKARLQNISPYLVFESSFAVQAPLPDTSINDVTYAPRVSPHLIMLRQDSIMLSQDSNRILEVAFNTDTPGYMPGDVVGQFYLSTTTYSIPKPEGIAFDHLGRMYVVGEKDSSIKGEPDFNRFEPTPAVPNLPPIAGLDRSRVSVVDVDRSGIESVTLDGSSSLDPNGSIIDFAWVVNGSTAQYGYGQPTTFIWNYPIGENAVQLFMRDDAQSQTIITATITVAELVVGHNPPVANVVFMSTNVVVDNAGNALFHADASSSFDPDGDFIVHYSWLKNDEYVSESTSPTSTFTVHGVGPHYLTLVVQSVDFEGKWLHGILEVTVHAITNNQPPVAAAIVPPDVNGDPLGHAKIFVDAGDSRDPEGDLIHKFLWREGDTILYEGLLSTATLTLSGAGSHTITLSVYSTDRDTTTQSGTIDFSVNVHAFVSDSTHFMGQSFNRVAGVDFLFSDTYGDYSGITFNASDQHYYMTDNKADLIFELGQDGSLIRTINIHEIRKLGDPEADVEGIAWMHGDLFAMVMETGEEMVIANITSTTTALSRSEVKIFSLSGEPKGVAYNVQEDALYWVNQDTPMQVVKTRFNEATGTLETLFKVDLAGLPAADLADIAFYPEFSPYAILLSQSSPIVIEAYLTETSAGVVSSFSIEPWDIPKPGGLTFNTAGNMVIVGKHVKDTPEDDFSMFSIIGPNVPPADYPIWSSTNTVSVNYIHPGVANQQAQIIFDLQESGSGTVYIYDQTGRQVKNFQTPTLPPGRYPALWDLTNDEGSSVSSGLYFVLVKTPTGVRKDKVVVVR